MIRPAFALVLFAAANLLIVCYGLRRSSGLLQYPVLISAASLGYVVPEALGVVLNPGLAPPLGLTKALIMYSLCSWAAYAGWTWHRPKVVCRTREWSPSIQTLQVMGLFYVVIGAVGFWKLASLTGGILRFYSVNGAYSIEWQGMTIVYNFFAVYLLPGYILAVIVFLRKRSWVCLAAAVPLGVIQLAYIVFLGRRSVLIGFLLINACILYFHYRRLPPRLFMLTAVPLLTFAVFVAPLYRAHSQIGGDSEMIKQIDVAKVASDVAGGIDSTVVMSAHMVEICDSQGLFRYGIGFYNQFILYYVPKLLVGAERKQALLAEVGDAARADNEYGWVSTYSTAPGGPTNAFEEFWYLGALVFAVLSHILRRLWDRAVLRNDVWAQFLYTTLILGSILTYTNDLYKLNTEIFQIVLPTYLLAKLIEFPLARRVLVVPSVPSNRSGRITTC